MDNHAIDPEAFARRYQDRCAQLDGKYPPWRAVFEDQRDTEIRAAADVLGFFGIPVAPTESDAEFLARRSFEVGVTPEGEWSRQSAKYREVRAVAMQKLIDAGVVTVNRDTPVAEIGPEAAVIEMHDAQVDPSSDHHGFAMAISAPHLSLTPCTCSTAKWKRVDATLTIRPALGPTP